MKSATALLAISACIILFVSFSAQDAAGQNVSFSKKCAGKTKQERAFLEAVEKGNVETVQALLGKGISANAKDDCQDTALIYAVQNRSTQMVDLLLRAGADASAENVSGDPVLTLAFDDKDDDAESPQEDNFLLVKSLLDAGADPNVKQNYKDRTVIILAARSNQVKSLELLLAAGAKVNARDYDDKTALSYATERGYIEAKTILRKFGANAKEDVQEYGIKYNDGAFIQATADNRADIVEEMLLAGFEVNSGNVAKVTALMRARNLPMVNLLLDAGANIHARDNAGFTPLIHLAANGNGEVVNALIKAGADIEAKTDDGKTALMFAALVGDAATLRALLEAGANVSTKDDAGKTALKYAVMRDNLEAFKLLRQAGAVE